MCSVLPVICLLLSVVFWNVENFFDYKDGGYSASDREFSSQGDRHWNRKRFDTKVNLVGKTLLWADVPEVVGLAEIENDFVLKRLVSSDILHKRGYRFVHYESQDKRGIDVALLYRADSMELVDSYPVPVTTRDKDGRCQPLMSRDILYVQLRNRSDGHIWHFFVNHHPSKLGGGNSDGKREDAMLALKNSVEKLLDAGETNIVAMGDFNDTPLAETFQLVEGQLVNMGAGIQESGRGSIRYKGEWQLIDNFLIAPQLTGAMDMTVLQPAFLLERDRQFPGDKPRRTYIGPRYNGGVSDHLPVKLSTAGPAAAE